MKTNIVHTIFRKELLDMLRDKRTVVFMLGVPIVLYPALFILGAQTMLVHQSRIAGEKSRVALEGPAPGPLREWLEAAEDVALRESSTATQDLRDGKLDAVVVTGADVAMALRAYEPVKVQILYDPTVTASREAARRIKDTLEEKYKELVAQRVAAAGLPEGFAIPLETALENAAPEEKAAGTLLGMILPLIMVVMLGVGAFYPAIDLTAGEKERGTFETLLAAPVSKFEIVSGKFVAVFVICMIAGLLNLGSMYLTFLFQFSQLERPLGEFRFTFPAGALGVIFIIMIPLAFFISAAMMSIAVFARSFKEAQNFVSPFLVLLLLPAAFAAFPDSRLTAGAQFIPVANVALLFKELMTGHFEFQPIFAVLISTLAYAFLALLAASWIFQREDVILAEDRGTPLTLRRASFQPRPAPPPGFAMGIYVFILLLIFYAGTVIQGRFQLWGAFLNQWLVILAPALLILWYIKIDFRNALSLCAASMASWGGSLLIAGGWVFLLLQFSVWHNRILPMPPALAEQLKELLRMGDNGASIWTLLLIVAFSPAVCEEVLFRGVLLSGFRQRMPSWLAILSIGALFGVYHLLIYKFLPTMLSGIVLTYLVIRGGSIYLAMAAHFILNGSALLIGAGYVPASLEPWLGPERIEAQGVPWAVLAGAFVLFAAGVAIMEAQARRKAAAPRSRV